MSDEFKMPSGFFTFVTDDGLKVTFEPLSAQEEWERIAEECKANPETDKQSIYLDRVGSWLIQHCGVQLNRSQVDFICDQTRIAIAEKKRQRRDAFLQTLPSRSSTE